MANYVGPDGTEERPVVLNTLVRIAADECVDHPQLQFGSGVDYSLEMGGDGTAMFGVGVKRIGIITEAGQRDAAFAGQVADSAGIIVGEVGNVHVADPRIAPIGTARRPAHRFDAGETFVSGKGQDIFQRKFAEDGRDETELHAPCSLSGGPIRWLPSYSRDDSAKPPRTARPRDGRPRMSGTAAGRSSCQRRCSHRWPGTAV